MSFILRDESRKVEQMKSEKCILYKKTVCFFEDESRICVCCGVCSCV